MRFCGVLATPGTDSHMQFPNTCCESCD